MMEYFIRNKTKTSPKNNVKLMYTNELNQFHPHNGMLNDMADTLHFQPRGYKYDTPISGKLYADVTAILNHFCTPTHESHDS